MGTFHRRRFFLAVAFSLLFHLSAFVVLLPLLAAWRAVKALLNDENEVLKVALLMALLLHVVVVAPLVHFILTMKPEDARMVQVDLWDQAAAPEEEEKTPEEQLAEYEPEEEIPDGQVVRAAPSDEKRPPKKRPRFLSEEDSRVEEETVSRIRIPGVSSAAPSPEMSGKGKDAETKPGGMRIENTMVGPPPPPEMEQSKAGDTPAPEMSVPLAPEDIDLTPSTEAMMSALAGTGLDHLDGVIEGDQTQVNTMGWKFASFFNRVKRQVERHWHPDREYRERDPYGNIYGVKDRSTVLLVVLRGDGTLKHLYVMEPSGAPFLDDEAVEAVRKGAPFHNVPSGLRDRRDGLVKFTFHFLVQVGNRPVFRMRRY